MRDDLLVYYDRELTYMRQMGAQFAAKYPRIAGRLALEPSRCEDPHVERLLQAFAFLAARVQMRMDDDFPEVTESLLEVVYPHLIRPVPSMSIVQFDLDPTQGRLTTGQTIPRETLLYSRPVNGLECKFSTCYETTLWPLTIASAQWVTTDRLGPGLTATDCPYAIRLEVRSPADIPLVRLGVDTLRLHLAGESPLVNSLFETLGNKLKRIFVRDVARNLPGTVLPQSALQPLGFGDSEHLLPYPKRSFHGYRLLQEYLAFPEKFHFVEIGSLRSAWHPGMQNAAEIVLLISGVKDEQERYRLQNGIQASNFRLHCTPIINLFPQTAEPILLDQRRAEYPVVPDIRRPSAMEVFSVEGVSTLSEDDTRVITYKPFYSHRSEDEGDDKHVFWKSHRKPASRTDDPGTEVYLSLVDRSSRTRLPEADHLTVRTLCTNRDLPIRLPFGNPDGDLEIESGIAIERILTLRKPTAPQRPPARDMAQWHLISHLSLNYLSLVDEGKEALQRLLRLYLFNATPESEQMISGIVRVHSEAQVARMISPHGVTFARGKRVEIEFDEAQFVGGGAYLFATVLERFFAHYASLNSFTQLAAYSSQRREVMQEWAPRAGHRMLL